ncbi:LysR substrate binding domain [Budvicia aquatica]|uniref:LysR substrate binding domain n=1 Tax=Budvicia aquatica TaxID=82979 RepID=A0A484ZBD3_9GAMM|nr:LysR substrate binding domain [Budvicia aquatica]
MSLYVAQEHPLAAKKLVTAQQLATSRQLCLNTYLRTQEYVPQGLIWSAPSYLLLLEMAEQGFGWAMLPRWLVKRFSQRHLFELSARGCQNHFSRCHMVNHYPTGTCRAVVVRPTIRNGQRTVVMISP